MTNEEPTGYDYEDPDNLRDAEIARQMEEETIERLEQDIVDALGDVKVFEGGHSYRPLLSSEREEIAHRLVQARPGAGFWGQKVTNLRTLLLNRLSMYQDARQAGNIPTSVPALIPIEEVLSVLDGIESDEAKK